MFTIWYMQYLTSIKYIQVCTFMFIFWACLKGYIHRASAWVHLHHLCFDSLKKKGDKGKSKNQKMSFGRHSESEEDYWYTKDRLVSPKKSHLNY